MSDNFKCLNCGRCYVLRGNDSSYCPNCGTLLCPDVEPCKGIPRYEPQSEEEAARHRTKVWVLFQGTVDVNIESRIVCTDYPDGKRKIVFERSTVRDALGRRTWIIFDELLVNQGGRVIESPGSWFDELGWALYRLGMHDALKDE